MHVTAFRNQLLALLHAPLEPPQYSVVSAALLHAFLDFGSETEDNRNCAAYIDYGRAEDRLANPIVGLRIHTKGILLSDLMNTVESLPLPDLVKADFPTLTEDEWSAVVRMLTMIAIALEHPVQPVD